jgi:methyl-accepting chemotaxis protein
MFREISNIRDVRVTPTAAIDAEREANMDMNERDVVRSHKPQFFSEEYMGEEVIRVIDPLIAEPGCLECHDAKVGDPLAVVSMRYSLEETNASLRVQTILATIIVVVCIVITFVVMMFLINKRIIVDLKRIIEALKKFAVGNVKDSITTDRKDELGDAVKSLRVRQRESRC